LVYDLQKGLLLKDLKAHGESIVIAKGGRGGRGNRSFATPTRRAPRIAEEGQPGEQRRIRFELKLIANAGIIGLPNSGKSTLLSKISAARPKIADFPFTTLYPCLGIVRGGDYRTCVVADLPGLIEGASCNIGLGHKFLKHIERTSILIHIVDVSQSAVSPPQDAYLTVRQELSNYSQQLAQKDEIIVANKMDLPGARRGLRMLAKVVPCPPIAVSALKAEGLDTLICTLFDRLP
jgi:GTP-binding protein